MWNGMVWRDVQRKREGSMRDAKGWTSTVRMSGRAPARLELFHDLQEDVVHRLVVLEVLLHLAQVAQRVHGGQPLRVRRGSCGGRWRRWRAEALLPPGESARKKRGSQWGATARAPRMRLAH